MSAQLQKVLSQVNDDYQNQRRIFEVNPNHPLVNRLAALSANSDNDDFIRTCGEQLFSNASLLEAGLPDSHDSADRVVGFMQELAASRSAIATE